MKKGLIFVILIALVVVLWVVFGNKKEETNSVPSDTQAENTLPPRNDTVIPDETTNSTDTITGTVKEFKVSGKNYSFTPSTMTVSKGDTVRITFTNTAGTHDLRIDEFNVATKMIGTGKSDTVEFVADKTGTFEYYCSVGEHRALGMKGKITVK